MKYLSIILIAVAAMAMSFTTKPEVTKDVAMFKRQCNDWVQPTPGSSVWQQTCSDGSGTGMTTSTSHATYVNGVLTVYAITTCTAAGCNTTTAPGPGGGGNP